MDEDDEAFALALMARRTSPALANLRSSRRQTKHAEKLKHADIVAPSMDLGEVYDASDSAGWCNAERVVRSVKTDSRVMDLLPEAESQQHAPGWQSLPGFLLLEICSYLRGFEMALCGAVCSEWRGILSSDVALRESRRILDDAEDGDCAWQDEGNESDLDDRSRMYQLSKQRYGEALSSLWRSACVRAGFVQAERSGGDAGCGIDLDDNSNANLNNFIDSNNDNNNNNNNNNNNSTSIEQGDAAGQGAHMTDQEWIRLQISRIDSPARWLYASRTCWFERCGERFPSFSSLLLHFRQRHDPQPHIERCNFAGLGCRWTFISHDLLLLHRRQHPIYLRRIRCSRRCCTRKFANIEDLNDHISLPPPRSFDTTAERLLCVGGKSVQPYPGSAIDFRLLYQYSVSAAEMRTDVWAGLQSRGDKPMIGCVSVNTRPQAVLYSPEEWPLLPEVPLAVRSLSENAFVDRNSCEFILWSRYFGGCLGVLSVDNCLPDMLRPCKNLEPFTFSQNHHLQHDVIELRRFEDADGLWLAVFVRFAAGRPAVAAFDEPRWLPLGVPTVDAKRDAFSWFDVCVKTNAYRFDSKVQLSFADYRAFLEDSENWSWKFR